MRLLVLLVIMLISCDAKAHDWYTGLKNKAGWSCCNMHDFKPVQAWISDVDGLWHALYPLANGEFVEYVIPPEVILDDALNQEPFQAHLAIVADKPSCFLRKAAGG